MRVAKHSKAKYSLNHSWLEILEGRVLMSAALPDLPGVLVPASNPALPAGFDIFSPPASGAASAKTPQIASWTESASTGDLISVSATNLTTLTGSSADTDTQFVTYGQTNSTNGALTTDPIEQIGANQASVNLAAGNATNSMYLLWAKNADGYGTPVAINKTDAWWVGPNSAAPGSSVGVYGQNLTYTASDGKAWIYITKAGSNTGEWAQVTSANPYKVDFTVPSDLGAGTYQVWAHNGHGGEYGWSAPVTLTVTGAAVNYNTGLVYNVKNFGATGNGMTDDTAAFKAAIAAAGKTNKANTVIYVPAGTYVVTNFILYGGELLGAGQGQTTIEEKSAKTNLPGNLVQFCSNTEIANITLSANNVNLPDLVYGRFVTNVTFDNVTLNADQDQYFDIHGDQLMFFTNTNFIGDGGFMGTASQVFFQGDHFYGTNDAITLLYSWGGSQISISNTVAQPLNPTNPTNGAGWADGRFFVGTALWGSENGLYFGDNQTIDMGVRPDHTDQNDGEQILWEGQSISTAYVPNRWTSTSNSLNVVGLASSFEAVAPNYEAIVVSGDGVGEHEPIAGFNSATGTVTLAQPWAVVPDSTSVIRFGEVADNIVVYQNQIQGSGDTNTASCAVQPLGGCFNVVIDSNSFSNLRYGVFAGASTSGNNVLPDYQLLVENNTINNAQVGVILGDNGTDGQTGTIGLIARDNTISNVTGQGILLADTSDSGNQGFFPIVQGNTVVNSPIGLNVERLSGPPIKLVLNNNTFSAGSASSSGSTAVEAGQTLLVNATGNSFTGFNTDYGGAATTTFKASISITATGGTPTSTDAATTTTSTPVTTKSNGGTPANAIPTAAQLAPPAFLKITTSKPSASASIAKTSAAAVAPLPAVLPKATVPPDVLEAAVEYRLALDIIGLADSTGSKGSAAATLLVANETALIQALKKKYTIASLLD